MSKIVLIEAFKEAGLVERPDLGCAMLMGALRNEGIRVTKIGGQENYLPEILLHDSREIYSLVNKFSGLKFQKTCSELDLTDFFKFVIDLSNKGFRRYILSLYQSVEDQKIDVDLLVELDYVFRSIMKLFSLEITISQNLNLGILNRFVKVIKRENPDFIGFSLMNFDYLSQALRRRISKEIKVKIILGGPLFSVLDSKQLIDLYKKDYADFIVIGQGEEALVSLIKGEVPLEEIPNLLFSRKKKIKINLSMPIKNLDKLPLPVFPKFKFLQKSFRILPLQTARGCTWRRCTFCSHHLSYLKEFNSFSFKRVAEILNYYYDKYGCNFFVLHDEELPSRRALALVNVIKDKFLGKRVFFYGYGRLLGGYNKRILKQMYQAGFRAMAWGLESGCQKVLDDMQKGIDLQTAAKVLKNSALVGIKNLCWVMVGFPGETKEEFLETLNFLQKNSRWISYVMFSKFELLINTYLYQHYKQFGLSDLLESDNSPTVGCKVDKGIKSKEALKLISDVLTQKMLGKIKMTTSEFDNLPDFNLSRMIIFKSTVESNPFLVNGKREAISPTGVK